MKAEISNIADLKAKRFTSVVYQLGRMRTDWDDNAAEQIRKNLLGSVSLTALGTGTPSHDGLIVQTQALGQPMQLAVNKTGGKVVADGVVGELIVRQGNGVNPARGPYRNQADLELGGTPVLRRGLGDSATANDQGYILYCDIWDKTLTAFDDKELLDVALHGADTTAREQRCTQLKIAKAGDLMVDESDPCRPAFMPDRIPGIGDGIFDLSLIDQTTSKDDCDPCATIIDIDEEVGNHLFRLEVHHVDYDPDDRRPTRLVLKYSKENGARRFSSDVAPEPQFVYEHFSAEAEQLMGMPSDDWKASNLYNPDPADPSIRGVFSRTSVTSKDLVRRWDGFIDLELKSGTWEISEAVHGDSVPTSSNIEDGTLTLVFDGMTLTLELKDRNFLAGDVWFALLRTRAPSANPDQRIKVVSQTPFGIRHHYCILGRIKIAFGKPKVETDHTINLLDDTLTPDDRRRLQFPSLTCLGAEDVGYDNSVCEMPSVATVQDAIDHLCQERDLPWHNKHLHGWGIVCGLIVECGPDTPSSRREVRLTPGYALDCDGNDINLENELIVDLLELIEAFQKANRKPLIREGRGSVCLFLDRGGNGQPEIRLEPYDPSPNGFASILEGTLLKDFYDDCIVKIIDALKEEFESLDREELERIEVAEGSLVSAQRRKLTSISNLIVQIFNPGNGTFVFLSRKEHRILRSFYLRLRQLLQSETFCAMFQGQDFPDYPFEDRGTTTYFGKNNHTRIKPHPSGKRVYTYGGTDNTINVYDLAKGELIEVIEMPSAAGAEVSAIAFSPDGRLLYAVASIRGVDSVFGKARIRSERHEWEKMVVLCDIEITEMEISARDPSLLHAIGRGKGLYFLRPEVLLDQTKPEVKPAYAFNAAGHMTIDQAAGLAYATSSLASSADGPDFYDQIAILDFKKEPEATVIPPFLALKDESGAVLKGDDGLALRPGGGQVAGGRRRDTGARLYVVVDGAGRSKVKQLLTYKLPVKPQADTAADNETEIEDTDIALAYHSRKDQLLLSLEDGYRLQPFSPDGRPTEVSRIPVQIQPVDLTADPATGQVYALNFVSNTVTAIPADELQAGNDYLDKLAAYRRAVLAAFVGLLGGLLQYLKDCFCHHLLVKCPTWEEDDKIYLACVEIRDNKVYKICNFDKRKYVKSFPTVDYWMSLVPILPAIRWAVEKLCCSVMSDFFDKSMFDSVLRPAAVASDKTVAPNRIKAGAVREGLRTFRRTDIKTIFRDQTKSVKLVGQLTGDNLLTLGGAVRRPGLGVKKQALLGVPIDDAVKELKRNKIEVDRVEAYDPSKANQYIARFASTPQRVKRGERVVLHEKDGKVLFYSTEPAPAAAVTIPEDLTARLDSLEGRKTELADFGSIVTKLQEVESRRAEVAELGRVRSDLSDLSAEREAVKNQLSALKSEVASVKRGREREAAQLEALKRQRAKFSTDLSKLNQDFRDVNVMHKTLRVEIAKDRPVRSIPGVTPQIAVKLRAAGVLTVGDMSKATAAQLRCINANTARVIKRRAGERIRLR